MHKFSIFWVESCLQTCDWVLINHGMYTSTLDDHWFFIWIDYQYVKADISISTNSFTLQD